MLGIISYWNRKRSLAIRARVFFLTGILSFEGLNFVAFVLFRFILMMFLDLFPETN